MKKIIIILSVLFISFPAFAVDTVTLGRIYRVVQNESASGKTTGDIAMLALEGLNLMDKNLKVSDQKKSLSIYYQARIIKNYQKPAADDVDGWVNLSETVINNARKLSKTIKNKDFEIIDTVMTEAFKKFDDGSKYYSYLDVDKKKETKKGLNGHFYDRMIDGVLYIKISDFSLGTKKDVTSAIKDNPDIKGLILDLRGNDGGSLKGALSVAELFIDEGVIISTKGKTRASSTFYIPSRDEVIYSGDMVILVDGQTASSAEALAASLQEQGRALLVGSKTFGKGSIQTIFDLPNDSALALTTAHFLTPADNIIDKVGITPDICTFGLVNSLNIKKLAADDKLQDKNCGRENRKDAELDIDVAKMLLTSP